MKNYTVKIVKTEYYCVVVKVKAEDEDEAIALAESNACDSTKEEPDWRYMEAEIEAFDAEEDHSETP